MGGVKYFPVGPLRSPDLQVKEIKQNSDMCPQKCTFVIQTGRILMRCGRRRVGLDGHQGRGRCELHENDDPQSSMDHQQSLEEDEDTEDVFREDEETAIKVKVLKTSLPAAKEEDKEVTSKEAQLEAVRKLRSSAEAKETAEEAREEADW